MVGLELCKVKEEDGNWRKSDLEEYELRAEREVDSLEREGRIDGLRWEGARG